jgi:hypothetical protein
MVIDALTAPVLTKTFIAAMKRINPKPFRHLVNYASPSRSRARQLLFPAD